MKTILTITLLFTCVLGFGQQQVFKSPSRGDTIYYDPSNPPQVYKGGVEYMSTTIQNDTITFRSVQPATLNQVTAVFQTTSNSDTLYLDWGEDPVVKIAGTTDQTITSQYSTINTTYDVKLYGDLSKLKKFYINGEATVQYINTTQFTICTNLTELYLRETGANCRIHTSDLTELPLTSLFLRGIVSNADNLIKTSDLVGMPLKTLCLFGMGTTFEHIVNTLDLVDMPLEHLFLSGLGTTGHEVNSGDLVGKSLQTFFVYNLGSGHTINTTHFSGMPLTTFYVSLMPGATGAISDLPTTLADLTISGSGTGISITSGTMKAWANATMTITSGYTTDQVDGFLNAWAPVAGTGTKTINLAGSGAGVANQARSSVSNSAVTTLQGKGKIIQTTL